MCSVCTRSRSWNQSPCLVKVEVQVLASICMGANLDWLVHRLFMSLKRTRRRVLAGDQVTQQHSPRGLLSERPGEYCNMRLMRQHDCMS